MNEVLKAILGRYSCRAYTDEALSREQLDAIARAAVAAPSAMNLQPWRVIPVTDRALLGEMDGEGMAFLAAMEDKSTYERFMGRGGKLFYNAPCMFLIAGQTGGDPAAVAMDCGIVAQNIALAACSLGLGSVICGMARIPFMGSRADEFYRRVHMPEGFDFSVAVLVGVPAAIAAPHAPDCGKIIPIA